MLCCMQTLMVLCMAGCPVSVVETREGVAPFQRNIQLHTVDTHVHAARRCLMMASFAIAERTCIVAITALTEQGETSMAQHPEHGMWISFR